MNIGAVQRFTLIDYPGCIGATLFTMGCTFRCPWCHNPELATDCSPEHLIPTKAVLDFLQRRRGKLEAITITGGEPTLQGDGLLQFAHAARNLGYLVKVDTNGSAPGILRELLDRKLVNYVAMDVKGPARLYPELTGAARDTAVIDESIALVLSEAPDYEFRTTVVQSLLSPEDLEETARRVAGANRYLLQRFVAGKTLDPAYLQETTYRDDEFAAILERVRHWVPRASLR